MVRRRMGQASLVRIEQRLQPGTVTGFQRLASPPIEVRRPRRNLQIAATHGGKRSSQVVGDVSARQQQNAFFPQHGQPFAQRYLAGRVPRRVHRQLDHRHVGGRKQVDQNRPSAVIQSPILGKTSSLVRQEFHHATGKFRRSGCRIAHGKKFFGKPSEVVDRFGSLRRRGEQASTIPMGRNDEHRPRPGQIPSKVGQGARPSGVFDRVHGGSVPREQHRHGLGRIRVHAFQTTIARIERLPRSAFLDPDADQSETVRGRRLCSQIANKAKANEAKIAKRTSVTRVDRSQKNCPGR